MASEREIIPERDRPNWVALRSATDVDDVFKELCAEVKADVEEIKKLPPKRSGRYRFSTEEGMGMFRVEATPYSGAPPTVVVFQQEGERPYISIETSFPPPRENQRRLLTSKWNPEKLLRAIVFVGEEETALELWQVSQRVLEPLLPALQK